MSFIAKFCVGNQNKKASTLYLSKEANSKDLHLKSQMVLSLTEDESKGFFKDQCVELTISKANFPESKGSEKIWQEFGFFKGQCVELTISKANFPESTLIKAHVLLLREVKKPCILICYIGSDHVNCKSRSEV